jgi:hypothetical protein
MKNGIWSPLSNFVEYNSIFSFKSISTSKKYSVNNTVENELKMSDFMSKF